MSRKAFDRKIAAVEALRSATGGETTCEQLRKALRDRNNYLVARAAAVAADTRCEQLVPDLLGAFDRFFVDAVKSDPQCLAKNALAKALRELGSRDPAAYERGIVHFQYEPSWGGRADSAAPLRGTCALALAECPLDDLHILTYLADGLADPDKLMRINCAIAIHQLNRPEGAPVLRLKLLSGDAESEVMGHCFASLLSLGADGSVAFVSRFLHSTDQDVQVEATGALVQSRDPDALASVLQYWRESLLSTELRRALVMSLGASPLREAADFLLALISREHRELATAAITALSTSRFRADMRASVAAAVDATNDPSLRADFRTAFGSEDGV